MTEKTPSELIRELLEEEFPAYRAMQTERSRRADPFDLSRPNIHKNKSDFLYELRTVQTVVDSCDSILSSLAPDQRANSDQHEKLTKRLQPAIDEAARQSFSDKKPVSGVDVAIRNSIDTSLYWSSLFTVSHMKFAYGQRLTELHHQQLDFWSDKHRPPNHYARAIALRFAKFYAVIARKKPTFGTSRDGPHPSTQYARILEKIFEILRIKASLKGPATYAVSQITDADTKPLSRLESLTTDPQAMYDPQISLSALMFNNNDGSKS